MFDTVTVDRAHDPPEWSAENWGAFRKPKIRYLLNGAGIADSRDDIKLPICKIVII
jgi:hypothetical protein